MSVLMRRLKSETIVLSDSDSDRLEIDSTCEEVTVRRSSRTRKSSKRFITEDFVTDDPEPSTSRKKPKASKKSSDGAKNKKPSNPEPAEERDPLPEKEPVDPHFLVAYVVRTKNVVAPGQYTVKLPVGPDEFVTVDGVEYLRGLGYYSYVEEEDDKEEVIDSSIDISAVKLEQETYGDTLSKRIVFESQRAMTNKSPPSNNYRIKEVDEPDQFSSASAYSSDEDKESKESVTEIDVTSGSPLPGPVVKAPAPESPRMDIADNDLSIDERDINPRLRSRIVHNEMEKFRRRQLAKCFEYVKDCILYPQGLTRDLPPRTPKVKILAEGVKLIRDLIRQEDALNSALEPLKENNIRLRNKYDELEAALKGFMATHPKTARSNAKTKEVLNSDEF